MPEIPSSAPPNPVKAPVKAGGKLLDKAKGIPKWGWAAAAGVFVLVLVVYARQKTATDVLPVSTDPETDPLSYDASSLQGVPLVAGGTSSPTTSSVGPAFGGGQGFSAEGLAVTGGDKSTVSVLPKFGEAFSQVTSLIGLNPDPIPKYPTLPGTYVESPGAPGTPGHWEKGGSGKKKTKTWVPGTPAVPAKIDYTVGAPAPRVLTGQPMPPVGALTGGGASNVPSAELHMLPLIG